MDTVSYEFLMKPKEPAQCDQTLSSQVGCGYDETMDCPFETNQASSFKYSNRTMENCKIMSSGGPEVDRPVRYSGKITADKLAGVVVHHTIDNQFVLILK